MRDVRGETLSSAKPAIDEDGVQSRLESIPGVAAFSLGDRGLTVVIEASAPANTEDLVRAALSGVPLPLILQRGSSPQS
jgi:hypothetical protein